MPAWGGDGGFRTPSQHHAVHCLFSSLPGRPIWPQLPGDVPESPGLQGAELLPARPLWLLLRLGVERLPLQPRYRDVGICHPALHGGPSPHVGPSAHCGWG